MCANGVGDGGEEGRRGGARGGEETVRPMISMANVSEVVMERG